MNRIYFLLILPLAAPLQWLPDAAAQSSFVNWETPHVHPVDLSPNGLTLAVCNTPDNRVLFFDVSVHPPVEIAAVPVGLDPVSVRFRTAEEVWVVNQISDSVSVVDVAALRVRATLHTLDEPADVVFRSSGSQAFVTCSQANAVQVFDTTDLGAPPATIAIEGEDPRALAYDPANDVVYAAIFESGNGSTILAGGLVNPSPALPNVVSDPDGPYGGENPPPNVGGPSGSFSPAQRAGNPAPPAVGLVVKRTEDGQWMDDNGGDWTAFVSGAMAGRSGRIPGWELLDHDVAVIDPEDLSVTYIDRLMNICMALAVRPSDGAVSVVGTDGTNEIRFEPNLRGVFGRVHLSLTNVGAAATEIVDLNPHLAPYTAGVADPADRLLSIGDPRGIVWTSDGGRAFVTGMGSNNVAILDANGVRLGRAEVGAGPTGIAIDANDTTVYVLNRFDASISAIDVDSGMETARVPFFDPTPDIIRIGRRHLYDTHLHSVNGHVSCATCHVDGRMDRLAWDLGDPSGLMKSVEGQNLGFGFNFPDFEDFHPMKGPMATQTLQDIIGQEPFHWRGDRDGIEEFGGAFVTLLGGPAVLSGSDMQDFEDFLATIHFPPNPFRNLDNTLSDNVDLAGHFRTGRFGNAGQPLPNGNAVRGMELYRGEVRTLDGPIHCVTCHVLPGGQGTDTFFSNGQFFPFPVGPMGEHHIALVSSDGSTNRSIKVPHLRNVYEKVGMELKKATSRAGFGFLHDGSVDSISSFMAARVFDVRSDQEVADLVALMISFAGSEFGPPPSGTGLPEPPGVPNRDSHAAVGQQVTLSSLSKGATLLDLFIAETDAAKVDLVVKGVLDGQARGWVYEGLDVFQSDGADETHSRQELLAMADVGAELTFTVVPFGSGPRIGVDRDEDGAFDFDEILAGSDPADPLDLPEEGGGEGEGSGEPEGMGEGMGEGAGEPEGMGEGAGEGAGEGLGEPEGMGEGAGEGAGEPEGVGEGQGEMEGAGEGSGEDEGAPEMEGESEGAPETEGGGEGVGEGLGEPEGAGEGAGESEGASEEPPTGPFDIAVSVSPPNSGAVTIDPEQGPYELGALVILRAVPGPDREFVRWSGGLFSLRNPVQFKVVGDMDIVANFAFAGEVEGEPEGMGNSPGDGEDEMDGTGENPAGEGASEEPGEGAPEGNSEGVPEQEGAPELEGDGESTGTMGCAGQPGGASHGYGDAMAFCAAVFILIRCRTRFSNGEPASERIERNP